MVCHTCWVTLPDTPPTLQSTHLHLRVLIENLLGPDYLDTLGLATFRRYTRGTDMESEKYFPRHCALRTQIPVLLTRWVRIRFSDGINCQW